MPELSEKLGIDLYNACIRNNVSEVQRLAQNASPRRWSMVLEAATPYGAVDVVSESLKHGAVVDEALGDLPHGKPAERVFRYLVEAGIINVTKWSDIYVDKIGDLLSLAADASNHSMVRYMLEKGGEPNRRLDAEGRKTTLACAAWHSDEEMVKLLLDYGARLEGSGALVMAAVEGKLSMVQMLIDRGADVNEMGCADPIDERTLGRIGTPLHKAVERGHLEVIDVLLQAGADVGVKDGKDRTAEEIGREKGIPDSVLAKLKPVAD